MRKAEKGFSSLSCWCWLKECGIHWLLSIWLSVWWVSLTPMNPFNTDLDPKAGSLPSKSACTRWAYLVSSRGPETTNGLNCERLRILPQTTWWIPFWQLSELLCEEWFMSFSFPMVLLRSIYEGLQLLWSQLLQIRLCYQCDGLCLVWFAHISQELAHDLLI